MDTKIIGFIGFVLVVLVFYILPLFSKKEVESRRIIKEIRRKELAEQKEKELQKTKEINERRKELEEEHLEQIKEQKDAEYQKYLEIRVKIEKMPIYKRWRNDVIERCGNKCQMCGISNSLEVHHRDSLYSIIKRFKITNTEQAFECKPLWNTENGEVLCKECHDKMESSKKRQSII